MFDGEDLKDSFGDLILCGGGDNDGGGQPGLIFWIFFKRFRFIIDSAWVKEKEDDKMIAENSDCGTNRRSKYV